MLAASVLMFALAATGFAQAPVPAGYRKVVITSLVDTTFVVVPKARTSGSTTVVVKANSKPEQHWYIKEGNSTIQLADTTLCLDGGAKSNWKDMGNIYVQNCTEGAVAQQWNVMSDGRIALGASSPQECIDLQYMKATVNNPVGLYSCAGLGNIGAKDKGINWPLVNITA